MWYQVVGWYGVCAILVAYALITFDQLHTSHVLYLALNGSGAAALIIQSIYIKNYPLIILNAVWLLVAVLGTVQLLLQ